MKNNRIAVALALLLADVWLGAYALHLTPDGSWMLFPLVFTCAVFGGVAFSLFPMGS